MVRTNQLIQLILINNMGVDRASYDIYIKICINFLYIDGIRTSLYMNVIYSWVTTVYDVLCLKPMG